MALHAMWVHGNSVRPEWVGDTLWKVVGGRWDGSVGEVGWSDVNGLPRGWGATYRGKRTLSAGNISFDPANPFSSSRKGFWFHFSIPTPVIVSDRRSRLMRVFVLWSAGEGVTPVAIHVWDGPNRLETLPVTTGTRGLTGSGGLADLRDGVTRFNLQAPREVFWSLGVSVAVAFDRDGDITFVSAGADFDV